MTFYARLGLEPSATPEQIKAAYRRLAHTFHPDRYPSGMSEDEKNQRQNTFLGIVEAYEMLSVPEKRAMYDNAHRPFDSLSDLLNRHPFGVRVMQFVLPRAKLDPVPGSDRVQVRGVEGTSDPGLMRRVAPWSYVQGDGGQGSQNGPPGDLWIFEVVTSKKEGE